MWTPPPDTPWADCRWPVAPWGHERLRTPTRPRPCPRAGRRGRLAEHRRPPVQPRRAARTHRRPGLLDLLLHQLPARPGRAQGAGAQAPGHGGRHRGALAEVRARGRARGRRGRGGAVRGRASRAGRPRARHLEAVRGAGLADARRDRSRGLCRRAARRRGACARHRASGDRAGGRARGQGHAAARRRPVRGAGAGADGAAFPGQGAAAAERELPGQRHHPASAGGTGGGRRDRRPADRPGQPRAHRQHLGALALQRTAGPGAAAGRLRGRRRHGEPRAAALRPGQRPHHHPRGHRIPVDAGRRHVRSRARGRSVLTVGRGVVAGQGLDRHGRHPPAVGVRPGLRHRLRHRRHLQRGPGRRSGRRGLVRAAVGARGDARPVVAGRLGDLGAALGRPRRRRPHRRRHRPLRLRAPRRRRRTGAAPAPVGCHGPARRLGGDQRHLQPRPAPLRPGDRRGHHPGDGPAGAVGRGPGRRRHRGRGVGPAPADPAAAARGGRPRRGGRPPHAARRHRSGPRQASVGRDLPGPGGPEAGHPVRPLDPAAGLLDPSGAAARARVRAPISPAPSNSTRPSRRAYCMSRRWPRPATTTLTTSTRRAMSTSRTGACRSA